VLAPPGGPALRSRPPTRTSSLTFAARRRRRPWRAAAALVAAAGAATLLAGGVGGVVPGGGDPEGAAGTTTVGGEARPDRAVDGVPDLGGQVPAAGVRSDDESSVTEPVPTTPPMARSDDLLLYLPASDPLIVGYHEAAHVSAVPLTPVGTVRDDRNTTRTTLPPDDPDGADYLVLTSRGRAAGPTSAVDVVLPEGTELLAPVTGRVLDVRDYLLYGSHEDLRIEIVPDGRPDLRLVLIHVADGQVEVGDRVVAGVTPIAGTARLLPFGSHIDRETEPDRHPHVHLELQPIDRPRPGDDEDAPEGD
jgi:hypothetical protein